MTSTDRFSCYLFGGDTLLIECLEYLLDEGHEVKGVVTATPRIEDFCRKRGVPVLDALESCVDRLRREPFDHLFAITHLSIIPDEILELPRGFAINFHDGPLPRHAGLNAPVWALMSREERYGITWHEITSGVDEGDILHQVTFEITPGETALSLNTKCMAAALESFPRLVADLVAGELSRTSQDLSLRSYHGRHDRPRGACLLDWGRSAEDIAAFVRALTFGPYPNPVGLPKICLDAPGAEPLVVSAAEVGDMGPTTSPGTVVDVGSAGVSISCGDGVVTLTAVLSLDGDPLTPSDLGRRGISAGARLDPGDSERVASLTATEERTARHEPFWAKRLGGRVVPELPFAREGQEGRQAEWRTEEVPLPERSTRADRDTVATVVAALGVCLARLGPTNRFQLAFEESAFEPEDPDVAPFYSGVVPLSLDLDPDASVESVVADVAEELAGLRERAPFLRDLILREPSAARRADQAPVWPVGVVVGNRSGKGSPLTLRVGSERPTVELSYDGTRFDDAAARRLAECLSSCLGVMVDDPSAPWTSIPLMAEETLRQLDEWNSTDRQIDSEPCIHRAIESQVDRTPDAEAVVFEGASITYRELDRRANRLARRLQAKGVGPGELVGIHVARSIDLVVATLAVLKAGGAYVPLDPDFPLERIALMVEDSGASVILSEKEGGARLPGAMDAEIVFVEESGSDEESDARPSAEVSSHDLAYVIYTSGSTGRPKGVLVEHRNVVNFFTGMDSVVEHEEGGVWLAVTSLSFDISVLELFWTLARGFTVVVYADSNREGTPVAQGASSARGMDFGLFLWGNDDGPGPDKYRLMLDGARFFDEHGFDSVWTPERHFHAFGGPFPNPSVTSAAIAAVTERIAIRSGSCVSPLHHPIRVAEEWAVVDNLSGGRVGLSFAAGWQPNDFVLRPESYPDQKRIMIEQIDVIRRLWRGDEVHFENPMGEQVSVTTLPRPVQAELPVWITSAGNPDTYRIAGSMGANVLTHLLGQSIDEVADKIRIYREAREEAGHDPDQGIVSLMLHTFVGEDDDEVREVVRQPMKDYLGSSMKLVLGFAWSFPAFKRPGGPDSTPDDLDLSSLSAEEEDAILDFAFERYFETSGLFGTPDTCTAMVERCKAAGVDEIACLLDFGVDTDLVLRSLPGLRRVRDRANERPRPEGRPEAGHSFPELVRRHEVTHLQCTPSMLRLLLADAASRSALDAIRHVMVGGEALPSALARELSSVTRASVTNMYGPTETTIWSSAHAFEGGSGVVPIGRPIANTTLYVLDRFGERVPPGIPGELYIGGAGVTRGYHERPDLTNDRFVADPFGREGTRMYRTGDRARFGDDGVLEFLGRMDNQVKIRGYRVELGEIEAALESQDGVSGAAVVVTEVGPGDQRLVGYFTGAIGEEGTRDLREALRRALPEYMVPTHLVPLETIPLTPNGKIDRQSLLSVPVTGQPTEAREPVEAASDLERAIAASWRKVLRLDRIGVEDNFFDVGGHSLLVVQLHRDLAQAIDSSVSLVDLYRYPTIRSLAEHLTSDGRGSVLEESEDRADRRKAAMGRRARRRT